MKATVRRTQTVSYSHQGEVRGHVLMVDEPTEQGGNDQGPTPQELLAVSLAGCVAITAEMYAQRKGWDLGRLEVSCEYEQAQRGEPTRFSITLRLPDTLSEEQVERIRTIAGKCPVHRTLVGPVEIDEQVELVASGES